MTKISKEALERLDEELFALQHKIMKLSEFIHFSPILEDWKCMIRICSIFSFRL